MRPAPPSVRFCRSSDLKFAAAALETVGDVFARFIITFGIGSGLRGGQFTYLQQQDGYEFNLDRVRWTEDLEVSGSIRWRTASGKVLADVTLRRNGKNVGDLDFAWDDVEVDAIASISGTIKGKRVRAQRLAP